MNGGRDLYTCPACGKRFTFWTLKDDPHPKLVCYYCDKAIFPKGEPPAAPAPEPAAKPAAATAPPAATPPAAAKPAEPAKTEPAKAPEPVKAG